MVKKLQLSGITVQSPGQPDAVLPCAAIDGDVSGLYVMNGARAADGDALGIGRWR